MTREKRLWVRIVSFAVVLALLLPLSPVTVVEEVQAVTQADIDKLKKKAEDLADQRRSVQEKLAEARAEKSELMDQKALLEEDIDLIQQTIASIEERIESIQAQIDSIQSQVTPYLKARGLLWFALTGYRLTTCADLSRGVTPGHSGVFPASDPA